MFIGIYPMLAMAAAGFSIYQLVSSGFSFGWMGLLLTTGPMMSVIMWLMMFKTRARTSAHFPLITLLALTGLGLTTYEYFANQQGELSTLLFTGLGFSTFIIYNYWYSSLGRGNNNRFTMGTKLPIFKVTDNTAREVSSESFLGHPTVIVFFRGNWCPLCMAQIKEITSQYKNLSALGTKIKFISPQPQKNTIKLADKHGMNFDFYTDKGNKAAKTLDIEMMNGLPMGMEMLGYDSDTVLPTVIITDKNGFIVYSDQTNNYRIRPEPREFLKILLSTKVVA